jgi:tetratricopeptide (TPR) repeat protein
VSLPVGKASRRKRERLLEASGQAAATVRNSVNHGTRPRLRLLAIAVVVAGVLALSLGSWLLYRGAEERPELDAVARLPNPDTTDMTTPVARAIREARQAALARPQSAAAIGRFCQVLHAHWLHDEASICYGIARKLAPEEFRWVYLLAGVEDIRGADGERVDQLFRESTRLAPLFPPVYVRHADALLRLGRWSEARDVYTAAVKLDPELVLAQRGLGQAAILLGDGPAAVEHLEQADLLSPGDRIVQVALARAYTLVGQSDRAAEAARKAQALDSETSLPDPVFFEVESLSVNPAALRGRLTRALQDEDFDTAIEAATLLEESGAPGARKQLAVASKQRANELAFSGDFDGALLEFERAARFAPADPEIEHNWGTVLLRRGDLEEAGRHFERAIVLDPQSADSLYNLGVVLEGLGRGDEAIARFTEAAAIDPQHEAAQRLADP